MRSAERLARWLRRGEVRAAVLAGVAAAVLVGVEALALYGFVAGEYLEEAERQLRQRTVPLRDARAPEDLAALDAVAARVAEERAGEAIRVRRSGPEGTRSWGAWPEPGDAIALARAGPAWRTAFALDPRQFLTDRISGPAGQTFEVALPLAHWAQEIGEVRAGLLAICGVSLVAGLGIALAAVRRSFAPLREGTRLLASMDAEHLDGRLATRGTGDFVDQHAEALNAALDRLAAAFERLQAFSADVAHELRTPIGRMRTAAEVALMEASDPAASREALESVMRSAEGLSRLIDALLLLARLGEGRQPIGVARFDAAQRLRQLLELYRPLFAERGIELRTRLAGELPLRGDPSLLDRAVCNLLDNAIRHAGAGGQVEVSGCARDGAIEIAVDDAGPGIAAADRERVFDRFTRLDVARTGPGSGVGLALARAIAEAHGGSLRVGDSPLGGARFALRVPAEAVRAAARAGPAREAGAGS